MKPSMHNRILKLSCCDVAALFFSTYETSKSYIDKNYPHLQNSPVVHMSAAACGETVSFIFFHEIIDRIQ